MLKTIDCRTSERSSSKLLIRPRIFFRNCRPKYSDFRRRSSEIVSLFFLKIFSEIVDDFFSKYRSKICIFLEIVSEIVLLFSLSLFFLSNCTVENSRVELKISVEEVGDCRSKEIRKFERDEVKEEEEASVEKVEK